MGGCGVAGAPELVELLALLGDGVAQLREFGALRVAEAGVPVPFARRFGQQRGGPPPRALPGERGAKVVSGDERLAVAVGHGIGVRRAGGQSCGVRAASMAPYDAACVAGRDPASSGRITLPLVTATRALGDVDVRARSARPVVPAGPAGAGAVDVVAFGG